MICGIGKKIKQARTALRLYRIWRSIDMGKLKSRKFWVTIASGTLVVFLEQLGVEPEQVQYLVGIAMAYLLGQGIADHGKKDKE